jgi:hypothetical protein
MLGGELERPAAGSSLEGLELTASASSEFEAMPAGGTLDGFEATSFEAPKVESAETPGDGAFAVASEASDSSDVEFLDASEAVEEPASHAPSPPRLTPLSMPAIPEPQSFSGIELPEIELDSDGDVEPSFDVIDADEMEGSSLPAFGGGESVMDALPEMDLDAEPETVVPAISDAVVAELLSESVTESVTETVSEPVPEAPVRRKRPTPSYVNLSDILHDEDEPTSARMTIGEPKQTGDHEADFQHILQEFRDGIEKTIPMDDATSHFDLGIAFREMGLVDDAIAEFQIASRSKQKRVESIEALGGCFLDKREPGVARTLLLKALDEPNVAHGDDTLRGVLYLLGLASEALGAREDGLRYYQRVYAVDIRFRDVAARIQTLQQIA